MYAKTLIPGPPLNVPTITATTTLVVDVIKDAGLHWPRLQDDTFIMSTGSVSTT